MFDRIHTYLKKLIQVFVRKFIISSQTCEQTEQILDKKSE